MPIYRKSNWSNNCTNVRCNYILPGRPMRYQPIVGNILKYDRMNTMGSLNSNIMQIANRINRDSFGKFHCPRTYSIPDIKRTISTGNRNPNF